ncbi:MULTISPECIES: dephospho-CoA kinase [Cryobacterium]|uniref:Dephospho-CoA kinase n=1 Tax=Cryobacterium levicorallinum TaxID=995038 RepID=A0A1I2YZS0_9MICO|nr:MULTISPECIES: dephospho-CoA kinase [Cryobacterium]TFB82989.1 dephospho-CoA kinase [Cryobacterium levicorallinum]TFD63910.1 dephospho-CoA kinase [Cryobacterium sp. Hh38]GEP25550.1 dephospho-CoA kinase [Cryobacterium levicorallinum]SFH31122.1 dephospho-CoA kinase [Cryobacterium levicorallinum]
MYVIGLTGGIASGKSTVAKRLAELGAVGIDADQLAREVVAPGTVGLAAIQAEFGDSVVLPDGSLNRPALGAIIFADPERRERLNAITHPAVRQLTRDRIAAADAADPHAIVVYDVPLLAEAVAGGLVTFDLVVVVHADAATRIRRMIDLRGLTEAEATQRIGAQATDEERLAIADVVINNTGSIAATLAPVDALWERVLAAEAGKIAVTDGIRLPSSAAQD